jgi:hypothetical protein
MYLLPFLFLLPLLFSSKECRTLEERITVLETKMAILLEERKTNKSSD